MNIIWDFDGTIFNTYPRILNAFFSVLIKKYQLKISEKRIEELVLIDTKHCARVVSEEFKFEFDLLLKEVRLFYDQSKIEEGIFPAIKEILTKENGTKHFLVTHRDKKSLLNLLQSSEIQGKFQEIITKDDGYKEKPDPESFEYLIRKYSLKRSDTIGIGDREIDVSAGKAAGIRTVLISQYSEVQADYKVGNAEELGRILRNFA